MVISKDRYRQLLAEMLDRAKHLPVWAISFSEHHPLSISEMNDVIKKHRALQATYTKDMSEIVGGVNAVIIIAGK
jgi:hypothetical protein